MLVIHSSAVQIRITEVAVMNQATTVSLLVVLGLAHPHLDAGVAVADSSSVEALWG